ncbi:leucine-rich repeat domain-containing protein [Patescibacteria group bacterium]|nr:leucine-rich repeat domain-containing protein [Patescibacteria group bacterium]
MKNIAFIVLVTAFLVTGCTITKPATNTNNTNENTNTNSEVNSDTNEVDIGNNNLNLSNQGLDKIPEYVFSQTKLESLNVSGNNLTGSIQAEIRHLQNLRVLNASNNQMTGVPAEIGQLSKLEILDLSNNQLTGLPNELANLKNLKALNLSGNNYSQHDLDIIIQGLPKDITIIK